jgi:hypothetical protein
MTRATPYYPPMLNRRQSVFNNRRMFISPPRDYAVILAEHRTRQAARS